MTAPLRVLFTDLPWGDAEIERAALSQIGAEVIEAPDGEEATLAELAREAIAIATCWAKVTERVIESAPHCRLVARMGIGLDNIAIPAASARGIPVTNVPDYCVEEVADHALALVLALARNVAFFHLRTKRGEYDLQAAPPMRRLSTLTLGLFGLGRTGRAMARKAQGLGLGVIAHTASGNDHGSGCRMVSLDELLARSDFLSIHAPLTAQTQRVFGTAVLERMKPTAALINTSRGAIVDADALLAALQTGRLAGAGLDVFEPEPPDLSHPLFRDERVIVTPHAAFVSRESLNDLRQRICAQIAAVLSGSRPENVVNPQIYDDRHNR
jgi:D-3-phosphoglycerate dehydrogenase